MYRPFLQKIRKGFHASTCRAPPALNLINDFRFNEKLNVTAAMPDDIKEGYFTVFAEQGKEKKRFVIELDNLTNPAFLSLLQQAEEEYGFQQKGALSLPCRPQELRKILQDWKAEHVHIEGLAT